MAKPLDLKNINAADFLKSLLKQKVMALKIVVFLIGAVVVGLLVLNFFQEKYNAESEMTALRNKLEVISRYKQSKEGFDNFTNSLPKHVEENALVNVLSDFAVQNNVEVLSFSGIDIVNNAHFDLYTVEVAIRVEEFKDALIFMKAIENAPNALRLESFEVNSAQDKDVEITLKISTVKTKNY